MTHGVTVREASCKSALVKSGITDYALNPYTGCAHDCVYCYASFMSRFSHHDKPWGQWVDAKVNIAEALAKDLRRLCRQRSPGRPGHLEVVISSVTDPYQPVEREYGLTRMSLEVIAATLGKGGQLPLGVGAVQMLAPTRSFRFSILTKSDLVVRDIDVLQETPDVDIGMTVTTVDDQVSRLYEPGASPATRRLAALRQLSDAGLSTWAFLSPVLPYHSDSEEAIGSILGAIQDAGVRRVMVDRFNPYPASVGRFLKVAPSPAAQALREYVARPSDYLDRLRDAVREASLRVQLKVDVLF